MLINVGEAYIVVNLIMGNLLAQDSDLQIYQQQDQRNTDGMNQQIHVESGFNMEADDDSYKLKLKIFGGPSAGEIYFYKPEVGKKIVIGRTPDCEIRINDKLLSKNQAMIGFSEEENGQWILSDGCNGKPSTNGTWLYLNENFIMHPGMIFKANQTIFNVEF